MEKHVLLALIDKIIEDKILNAPTIRRGPRGLRGSPGRSIDWEAHKEEVFQEIKNSVAQIKPDLKLRFEDLTVDEKEGLKLKFSDLTDEEKLLLKGKDGKDGEKGSVGDRGPRGLKGQKGKSFVFAENEDRIRSIISDYINSIKEGFKLRFEDLSEEEVSTLRGPRGQRGKSGRDGKSFDFEEQKEKIKEQLYALYDSEKDSLKLKFKDLSEDEKDQLKLKFENLTEEEKRQLKGERGPRGQKGSRGAYGLSAYDIWLNHGNIGTEEDFLKSLRGAAGAIGSSGRDGQDGRNGRDGQDARQIVDVEVVQSGNDLTLIFVFDDGSEIATDKITLPEIRNYITSIMGSSGGGTGGGGTDLEIQDEGSTIDLQTSQINFVGQDVAVTSGVNPGEVIVTISPTPTEVSAYDDGGALVNVGSAFQFLDPLTITWNALTSRFEVGINLPPTNNEIEVFENGVSQGTSSKLNFLSPLTATYDIINDRFDIDIDTSGFDGCVRILDEGIEATACVTEIDFTGPGVSVIPKTVIADWPTMDVVDPIAYYSFGQPEVEVVIPGDSPWEQPGRKTVDPAEVKTLDIIAYDRFVCAEYKICFRSTDQANVSLLNYLSWRDDIGITDQIYNRQGKIMNLLLQTVQVGGNIEVRVTNNELYGVDVVLTRLLS